MNLWGEGVFRVLVGIPEGKRTLGRPRRKCVDNIRMTCGKRLCIVSWWGNRRERDNWRDLGVDGSVILGWIWGEAVVNILGLVTGRKETTFRDLGIDGWIILRWVCGERAVYRELVWKPV